MKKEYIYVLAELDNCEDYDFKENDFVFRYIWGVKWGVLRFFKKNPHIQKTIDIYQLPVEIREKLQNKLKENFENYTKELKNGNPNPFIKFTEAFVSNPKIINYFPSEIQKVCREIFDDYKGRINPYNPKVKALNSIFFDQETGRESLVLADFFFLIKRIPLPNSLKLDLVILKRFGWISSGKVLPTIHAFLVEKHVICDLESCLTQDFELSPSILATENEKEIFPHIAEIFNSLGMRFQNWRSDAEFDVGEGKALLAHLLPIDFQDKSLPPNFRDRCMRELEENFEIISSEIQEKIVERFKEDLIKIYSFLPGNMKKVINKFTH